MNVKKKPSSAAAVKAAASRKQPAAAAAAASAYQSRQLKLRPATPPVELPNACIRVILEYCYMGAVHDIGFMEYLGGQCMDDWFPSNLRGCVLQDGRVLLCSNQLPLLNRRGMIRISPIEQRFSTATLNDGLCWIFREMRKKLQARLVFVEELETPKEIWNSDEWDTFGKTLGRHHHIAVLSKYWYHALQQIAPCNFKYVLNRCTRTQDDKDFWMDVIVCIRGTAPEEGPEY